MLEYLLLFQGKTDGINGVLRAGLSVFTIDQLIAAIFAGEAFWVTKKSFIQQKNTSFFGGKNSEFMPYFVTARCRNGGSALRYLGLLDSE